MEENFEIEKRRTKKRYFFVFNSETKDFDKVKFHHSCGSDTVERSCLETSRSHKRKSFKMIKK
jgi:hypothetical protein